MTRLLALLLVLALSSVADAQLLRRRATTMHQAHGNHWGYPGDIASHLASSHGQQVAGLSHSQMLSMHDALHEGRQVTRVTTSVRVVVPMIVARPTIQSKPMTAPMPVKNEEPITIRSFWK